MRHRLVSKIIWNPMALRCVSPITFEPTVLATLPIPIAIGTVSQGESFAETARKLKIIHPPCLSTMHTWGVFSFWGL